MMSFHSLFHGFIRRLYYSRITVSGAEHIPSEGPLLALCLHRNGAVDGFVYRAAIPRLTYLVRAKLRRGLIGKLFFPGVEVVRAEDGGSRAGIRNMIQDCAALLGAGGRLAILPEGTSDLGPHHLPFRRGASWIADRYLQNGAPLTVLPLGIHYECPWAFRSRVEIVVGQAITLSPDAAGGARPRECHRRFTEALEAVGINVPDETTQDLLQTFAYAATLGTAHGYFDTLKAMEKELPPDAVSAWRKLEAAMHGKRMLRHQGVPLFPLRAPLAYVTLTLLLGIPVLAGAALNLFPIAVAWYCGRRFSDARNVIALWRILTGVPAFILWALGWMILPLACGHGWITLIYMALTYIAIAGWYRLKKLAVASWNGLFFSKTRNEAIAWHRLILNQLERRERPHELDT